jgi:type IV pilus assembly protein PilM
MIAIDLGSQFIKICFKKDNEIFTDVFEIKNEESTINKIKNFLKKNKIKEKLTLVSLNSPKTKILKIELPKLSKEELDNAVKFQAMTLLNITSNDFEKLDYDYFISSEDENNISVFFIALEKNIIDEKLKIISKCGLIPLSVNIDGLCFANYFLKTESFSKNQSIVLLNIGAKCSSLVYLEKGELVFLKNIEFGGANITERIQREKNISFEEAEKIKREPQKAKELESIINETTKEFVLQVLRLLEYLLEKHIMSSVGKIVVSGGGALTPFLETILLDESYVMVELHNPIKGKKEGVFFSAVLGLI